MPENQTGDKRRTTYKNQWTKENMDRISLALPKGTKERIQTHAKKRGESVNGFIGRAVNETMERDDAQEITDAQQEGA